MISHIRVSHLFMYNIYIHIDKFTEYLNDE